MGTAPIEHGPGPPAQTDGSHMDREPKPLQGRGTGAPRESDYAITALKKGKGGSDCYENNEESGKRGSPAGKKMGEEPGLSGECRPIEGQGGPGQFRRQQNGEESDTGQKTSIGEALR